MRAAPWVLRRLRAAYPDAHCALEHRGPFQLLVATILSAQCTDKAVNRVTPELFRRWPDAVALAAAAPSDVEGVIRTLGLYRTKARNIVAAARALVAEHRGAVPKTREALVRLPGVGRKTANVVLSNAFGLPGLAVDTHVLRLARRLGLSRGGDPEAVERDLCAALPPKDWGLASHVLIWHGRAVCAARSPRCGACVLAGRCPSAKRPAKG